MGGEEKTKQKRSAEDIVLARTFLETALLFKVASLSLLQLLHSLHYNLKRERKDGIFNSKVVPFGQ